MRVSSNVGDSILLFTGDGNLGIGTTAPISGNGIPSLDIYKANGTCRVTLTPCVLAFCNTGYCAAGGMLGGIAFGGGDSAGNGNKGILIGDYSIKKESKDIAISRDSFMKTPKIDTEDKAI